MSLNAGVLNHPCLQAIFVRRFYVSLPTIFLQSEEEYKRRGRYSTGDPDIDKAVYNERTRTYMTINEMFELWKIGCTVGLVRYDDAKAVYEAIEEHLSRWYNFMTRGFNLSTCPFDELLDLDRFAKSGRKLLHKAETLLERDDLLRVKIEKMIGHAEKSIDDMASFFLAKKR